ncbi:class I SAM-dependent methyltransferase [Actinoalloteichus sp. AHMU CJ021]|uniref:Methyltransferase domain-containing protein n=3 Tax=Actinoalloteichus cyanogriseus TaxID=2893586 RepID=A0ABT1JKA5_ACTCY|nr:class I SAM-dependent methyltransferase [Actinoalloteichus caeruleus]AUS78765.1 class I SAM-dependent methyltransferase [Actinoalloteichus sp. AHMU CJ021]MCP2332932.1 Methyltransferase domain-containing protein [Actinoalloteichus caeruleus DSM 43889]
MTGGASPTPSPSARRWGEHDLGRTEIRDTYRADLRPTTRDVFAASRPVDFATLDWRDIGRPHRVENWAAARLSWEAGNGRTLPVPDAWKMFNRSFQHLFDTDPVAARAEAFRAAGIRLRRAELDAARRAIGEVARWTVWNQAHRVGDTVWDPRAKRSLFDGLDLRRPRVLFLGAADGYEAMLLSAMYPGGESVLVDYDDYCRDHRFGSFPTDYPFLGVDPATGSPRVWHRDQMDLSYLVSDIRDLDFGPEFDVVVSIGLVEHFPDEHKPEAFDWHRRFLRPGGYAILTTPRVALRTRMFYRLFGDLMNFSYRELQTVEQLGLYAHENGFEVLRHGEIKTHNGVVCRPR